MQNLHRTTTDNGQRTTHRRGFTLVELLMVILILAALIALLLPAVASVRSRVLQANVRTEISNLENAIATFRTAYGVDPPSRITLYQNPADWNTTAQGRESKAIIRRIWPNFNFDLQDSNGNYTPGGMPAELWSANGNTVVTLYADECLVFFLGGMADSDGALVGFSTNPATPFAVPTAATVNQTRKGPFFDFAPDRIKPSNTNVGARIYLDPMAARSGLNHGYLYVSSRDGRGYNPDDLPPKNPPTLTPRVMADVYRSSKGTGGSPGAPYKPKGFQIIAPGPDGEYGQGGYYHPDEAGSLLTGNRAAEADNITNFHDGALGG